MNPSKYLSLALVVVATASACQPVGRLVPAASPTPSTPARWSVKLTQSGGIAGVNLSIQVAADGSFSAEDVRSGRRVSGVVPPDLLQELDHMLAALAAPAAPSTPTACADCFVYDLEFNSGQGTVRIRADDVSLEQTGAQALIVALQQIRDSALSTSH